MVQKVSSLKAEGLSPSDCDDHSEEKEISDDDDDDRNHKHRRREAQSLERDVVDQVFVKPNRKRNKPFENGNFFRGNDSQSSEPWKTSEPWKRRPIFARGSNMANQPFLGDLGQGRGRGKELSPWIHHDPRFSSVIGSQMVPPGPNMFAGRGLGSSWSAYGLMPPGVLDPLPPLGLQGAFRPSISPPPNMGIMRQRCRDFEERGFCLRGDMCPMEHGINRIVVEDVQSLSQFNLPVSLPSGNPIGSSSAALPSSSTMMNSNSLHGKSGKPERTDGGTSNGVSTVSCSADGSDFYDPDQPLWASDCPGTSTALQGLNPSKFDETEFADTGIEHIDKANATAVGSQGTSTVWGRVGSKNKSEIKGRFDSASNKAKQGQGMLPDFNTSLKTQDASQFNIRKQTQKALRTVFVNCIPKKENNVEALLSHFKKFGEIIDIYIPHTGDRAFVQFSKREEAERALKAPDAVMGNRFIKLSWANRDRITEDVQTPRAVTAQRAPPYQSVTQKGKDGLQPAALESKFPNTSISITPRGDNTKPVGPNTSKATPPSQKKPGNLALLEEFRKRQESFAQKRDALQRELAKLEKKAAGSKGEASSEKVAKRQKVETVADSANAEAPNSSDSATKIASPKEGKNSVEIFVDQSTSKPVTTVESSHEGTSLKQSIRPLAPPGAPFGLNRFKLDNRPTAFKISPPLPAGLENIDVLKEHFSAYGEISSVEIDDGNSSDSSSPNNCSALISFTNRRSAEKAFINGKTWQDQTLHFTWTPSTNISINENEKKEKEKVPPSVSEASNTVSADSGNLGNKNSEDLRSSSSSVSGNL